MASVTLSGLWIHDGHDPAHDYRTFRLLTDLASPEEADGQVLQFGPRRIVRRRPGRRRGLTFTIRTEQGWTDLNWLRSKTGRLVLVRSYAGDAVWGVWWSMQPVQVPGSRQADVTITVEPTSPPVPLLRTQGG